MALEGGQREDDVFGEQYAYEMQDEATPKQMLHEVLDLGRRKQLYVCIHLFSIFFMILGLGSNKGFFLSGTKKQFTTTKTSILTLLLLRPRHLVLG